MAIGLVTMLPLAYVVFFFCSVMLAMTGLRPPAGGAFALLFAMHFAVILLGWCLMGFYIYQALATDRVSKDHKPLWVLAIIAGGGFGMLAFWYLYIWKPAEEENTMRLPSKVPKKE